jgi:hypothetical protein
MDDMMMRWTMMGHDMDVGWTLGRMKFEVQQGKSKHLLGQKKVNLGKK